MQAGIDKSKFTYPLIETEQELEKIMCEPSDDLANSVSKIDGDFIVLGGAGKMGPTLTKLLKNAIDKSGTKKTVTVVGRNFSDSQTKDFTGADIKIIKCDLLNDLDSLPDIKNVVYMAGMKFGTSDNSSTTWALNTFLPGLVAKKYRDSRIVAFSTGNIYHLTPLEMKGATEEYLPCPYGEYAQSCLGREKMFEYFSRQYGTKGTIIRLAYAIDLRYGIILDVAQKIYSGTPIDLSMGHVNLIWQGDANEQTIRSFEICNSPTELLNVTGKEIISIKWLAEQISKYINIEPKFEGKESDTALLLNPEKACKLFGNPKVSLDQMIQWISYWIQAGGKILGKPTHYEQRNGKF